MKGDQEDSNHKGFMAFASEESGSEKVSLVINHFSYLAPSNSHDGMAWFLDSGATIHMSGNLKMLDSVKRFSDSGILRTVTQADGTSILATGVGKAVLRVPSLTDAGSINEITLSEVWYVPDLSANLLSIHTLNCKGLSLNFAVDLMTTISNLNVPIVYARTENQLHHLVTMDEDAYAEVLIA